ncbi:MAG: hypothetical protein JST11_25890 [Acidobacteria bacterium]|nr:hypothetical protein [Acidobacteriota bacterium]
MNSPDPSDRLLAGLIHDLRQPLGNIECSAWCLASMTESADPRVREQVHLIERQVEEAARLLAAAAELNCASAQRAAAPASFAVTNPASSGVT